MSRVERAVTYVGLEIIGKLANVLGGRPGRVLPWTRSVRVQEEGRVSLSRVCRTHRSSKSHQVEHVLA
jgi:hypothetical protein